MNPYNGISPVGKRSSPPAIDLSAYLTEADAAALYALLGHIHDDRYFTEAEVTAAVAAAIAAHNAAADPHPLYLLVAEANALYEVLGTSAAGIAAHLAAGDPHPQYLTPAEGIAAFEALGAVAAHAAAGNPHPVYLTQAEADALYLAIAAYTAADILTKIKTVDGGGSGLDADLIHGISGALFMLASAYTAADVLAKLLTVDGPGSGLNADLLDNLQLDAVANVNTVVARDASGYIKAVYFHSTASDNENPAIGQFWTGINGDGYLRKSSLNHVKITLGIPIITSNSPERGPWNPLVTALRGAGRRTLVDEDFAAGVNGIAVYNNLGNGCVTITRDLHTNFEAGIVAPNSSGYSLKISYLNPPGSGGAAPGFGGFHAAIQPEDNHTFVQIFQAKLPVGRTLVIAENSQGDNATSYWITPVAGTGKFEWYARVSHCGNAGSFVTGGHVYVTGGADVSFDWFLASLTVIDVTEAPNFWTAENDGAASGLDADLLDGANKDSAYNGFVGGSIPVRHALGYIFSNYFNMVANQVDSVVTRIVVDAGDEYLRWQTPARFILNHGIWTSGNDGAGSGLDADLLDGANGAAYLARANHTGTQLAATISDFEDAVEALGAAAPDYIIGKDHVPDGVTVVVEDGKQLISVGQMAILGTGKIELEGNARLAIL